MALTGDFAALADFYGRLRKFSETGRKIAQALAPKVEGLVGETFAGQHGPNGETWPPTKSGAPAFGGGDAGGRVLSRLVGKASIKTTVLYPLHFHQDGTHVVGKKRGAAIKRGFVAAAGKAARSRWGAVRKRKNETEEQYQRRLELQDAIRADVADARASAKRAAEKEYERARTAGGWHDPPRPMIPDEGDAIPATWVETITETARPILAEVGAT